jgi:hypothetical protein
MNNEFSDQATPDKMKELMNGFSQTDYWLFRFLMVAMVNLNRRINSGKKSPH